MHFKFSRIDIEKTRAGWPSADFMPALVLPRSKTDNKVWHIIDKPVVRSAGVVPSWAVAAGDEYIRIPLFEYELPPQGDLALAAMLQLGLICSRAPVATVNTAHIITGNPVELTYNTDGSVYCMTSWIGLALTFEEVT